MKKLILGFLMILGQVAAADTLSCYQENTFLPASFTISRDGGIGFNGTYITIDLMSPTQVSDITGRAEDELSSLRGLTLALSPKDLCTNPNGALMEAFKCSGIVSIAVKGERSVQHGDITDEVTKVSHLTAQVDVELDTNHGLLLKGTVKGRKKDVSFSVPAIIPQRDCKTVQP